MEWNEIGQNGMEWNGMEQSRMELGGKLRWTTEWSQCQRRKMLDQENSDTIPADEFIRRMLHLECTAIFVSRSCTKCNHSWIRYILRWCLCCVLSHHTHAHIHRLTCICSKCSTRSPALAFKWMNNFSDCKSNNGFYLGWHLKIELLLSYWKVDAEKSQKSRWKIPKIFSQTRRAITRRTANTV